MLIADAQVRLWKSDPPDGPLRHGARPFQLPDLLAAIRSIAIRHPVLRIAIDHMGIDRGDTDHAAFAHREWIMGRALCEWLGWKRPEGAAR
jgi:hypothetical protein